MLGPRGFVTVLLLLSLFFLCTNYAASAQTYEQVAQSEAALKHSERNIGQQVYIWATVVQAEKSAVVVTISGDESYHVVYVEQDLAPGDLVQVFGTISSEETITAERVIVSEQTHLLRMIVISLFGLLISLFAFFEYWRIDIDERILRPREEADA